MLFLLCFHVPSAIWHSRLAAHHGLAQLPHFRLATVSLSPRQYTSPLEALHLAHPPRLTPPPLALIGRQDLSVSYIQSAIEAYPWPEFVGVVRMHDGFNFSTLVGRQPVGNT